MRLRTRLSAFGSVVMLPTMAVAVYAQNAAPFTIKFPPDGATVREKVRISVPLASIPDGAYVAYHINGEFRIALAPTQAQRDGAKPRATFDYVWDSKAPVPVRGTNKTETPKDGEYTLSASLYVPKGGTSGASSMTEVSSVKVTLANVINEDVGPISLAYRYADRSNTTFDRSGSTSIVAGLSQGVAGTGDVELVAQNSELLLAVEDLYTNGNAIVRNKLTKLAVRQNGQESRYPSEMLPKSFYQELDPHGVVRYPTEAPPETGGFWQLGVPISATMDLPILPRRSVRVGDTWDTKDVVLEIPGTPPSQQPKVQVKSTFAGLEWEGGYQTARIHQEYKGSVPKQKSVTFANIEVQNPQLSYERDIFIAYRSGQLVKTVTKLDLTGKTAQAMGGTTAGAGAMTSGAMSGGAMMGPGMMMGGGITGPPMAGGMSGPPMAGGMSGPPMGGGGITGPPMGGGGRGGRRGGMIGPGGGMSGPGGGITGPGGGRGYGMGMPGGRGGRRGGMTGPGGISGPPMSGAGMPSSGPGSGMMLGPGYQTGSFGGGTAETTRQITLKSLMTTSLKPQEQKSAQ